MIPILNSIWNTIKYDLSVFPINESKLEKQLHLFYYFIKNGGSGLIEAVTGFGKTFIAIIAIKRMNLKNPGLKTDVVVPNTKLLQDWLNKDSGYIKIYRLKNVSVYVVNSYIAEQRITDFLICDEAHRYLNEEATHFIRVLKTTNRKFTLCLSGSLTEEQIETCESFGVKLIGRVTQKEAEYHNWISKSVRFNFGIQLSESLMDQLNKLDSTIDSCFQQLDRDYELARGCSLSDNVPSFSKVHQKMLTGREWRKLLARQREWDGDPDHDWSPKNIKRIASLWSISVQKRMNILYNNPEKLKACQEILKFYNKKSILFSQNVEFVEILKSKLENDCETYHSNLKSVIYENKACKKIVAEKAENVKGRFYKLLGSGNVKSYQAIKKMYPACVLYGKDKLKSKILTDFKTNKIKFLLTVKSLDEGFDDPEIELALTASGESTKRQRIQRNGRASRTLNANPDKTAILIDLYCMNTQEELWLKSRQQGIPVSKINKISSIEELSGLKDLNTIEDFFIPLDDD